MFSHVLVLCVGNICRSPTAEYLLRARAEAAGQAMEVASAGLGALVGHEADPLAREVAAEHGLDLAPHRARQLTGEMLRQHDLVLVMEDWQRRELEAAHGFAKGRIHLLGKWNNMEIADPYKKPRAEFERAWDQIEECVGLWSEKLWP